MPDHSTEGQVCHQNPLSSWDCPTCPMDVNGMSIRHPTLTDQDCPIVLSMQSTHLRNRPWWNIFYADKVREQFVLRNTTIGDKAQSASFLASFSGPAQLSIASSKPGNEATSFPGSLKNREGESQVTSSGNVVDYWHQALPALIRLQNETMHTGEILSTQQKLDNSKMRV